MKYQNRLWLAPLAIVGVGLAMAIGLGADAGAQSPPSAANPLPPTASQPDPRPCAPPRKPLDADDRTPSETTPGAPPTTGQAPNLSEQLAKGEGVLCPPKGVDPAIVAPTPEVGTMPIIPPPGTPGGDPTVRPK